MKRVYKIDRHETINQNDDFNPNMDYLLTKNQCHRCKQLGVFICEHDTPIRDTIKSVYAEEGRYYMSPRRYSGVDYGESLRSYSGMRRSNTGYLTRDANSSKNYPRLFNVSNKGAQANQKNKQIVSETKKDSGCCSIS